MGGTYRSARLPVRGPPAIGRFHQKSTVGGQLKGEIDRRRSIEGEIDRRRSIEREKGRKKKKRKKKKKRRKEEKKDLSPARGPRPCAVAARRSRALFLPRFEKPSAIQQRGIVPFCKGLDVIQQAQSGTGKTATFCAGILQQLDYGLVQCQALVLAPTRELAQQIEKVMRALGDYLGVKVHACVGGTSVREDQRILSSGVHVVVGTPGRVFDMLRRQSLRPDNIKMFVLDEADEMLSRGFKDQVGDFELYHSIRVTSPPVDQYGTARYRVVSLIGAVSAPLPPGNGRFRTVSAKGGRKKKRE
ncbi:hypothetical protein BHM03_00043130 [Ensete ventricosum]|nr:hypothetical protein BHM03_00043130 [Ensete ventricosum]